MPSTATLHYFDDPGRAEATRVALAYAGKDFEDKFMGFPEYGASKWAGIGLPVLEMDDAEYTQSTALLRYAGKLGGLYPDDALAALKVDEIVMIAEDLMANMFKCVDQRDDTMAKGLLEGKIKTLVDVLTLRLAANPSSKFFVGNIPHHRGPPGARRDQELRSELPEGSPHDPHSGHRSHARGDAGCSPGGPQVTNHR